MSSKLRDMASAAMGRLGIIGIADVHICADADGGANYDYWNQWAHADKDVFHTLISTAHDATTTGRNDTILLTPSNHALAAAITWSRSNTHLVGMGPIVPGYNPAYFSHTVNADVLWTVSGNNNAFYNVRWLHGYNSATNAHCLETTGNNNSFFNCHFEGPEGAAEKAVAGYDLVKLSGEYNHFENCMFGNTWAAMTDVSALLGFTGNKAVSSTFKNCIFQKNCGNTTNLFIHTYQSLNAGSHLHFDNCTFQNMGTSTPAYAIDGYGLNTNNCMMTFNKSSFCGVSDVVALAYEAYVWFNNNAVYDGGNAQMNGLAANPDVS